MWIRVDGQGMSDEVLVDLHTVEELDVSAIRLGECYVWLNLDTGASILHLEIGGYQHPSPGHALVYRSPKRELIHIGRQIPGSAFNGNVECKHRSYEERGRCQQRLNHEVELMLQLRDDEFNW